MGTTAFPTAEHDHNLCVDDALAHAERICGARGARLTALRRQVLEIVWNSHRPIGAYDVLPQPLDRQEVVRIVSLAWLHWRERSPAPIRPQAAGFAPVARPAVRISA